MPDNINEYRDKIQKNKTSEELNNNSQSVYLYDLIYIICKVFLFIILGVSYVLIFKNFYNIKNILMDAKNNITEKLKPVTDKLKQDNPEKIKQPDKNPPEKKDTPSNTPKPVNKS